MTGRLLKAPRRLSSLARHALLTAALGAPLSAGAWSDADADRLRYEVDNCSVVANGPNQTSNQIDSDLDGYGNRCDTDYDNNLSTTAADFGVFLGTFGTNSSGETDHDGNGTITAADFSTYLARFSGVASANRPGPSGLWCAGSTPCRAYVRLGVGGTIDTPGLPNAVVSPTDYDVVTFEIPPGYPGSIALLHMVVGAPGGLCADGVHCYADGRYSVAGWSDLAEAAASPTTGTLFHIDVTGGIIIDEHFGSSNGGVPGNPSFPISLLEIYPSQFGDAFCPATGCVIAVVSDVSAAPGLVVETRTSTALAPGEAPIDRALCPVGCEGGLPVGTAGIQLHLIP